MIRVLVVEDSATVREFLLQILESDPAIEVVGTAATGEEAVAAVERIRPDIITMDVHMPRMNGFDATRRIMETRPTPIVMVSGAADATDTAKAFHAIECGALAVLAKPTGIGDPTHEQSTAELVRTVKLMSEVKVVRRWPRYRPSELLPVFTPAAQFHLQSVHAQVRIVAMGASTGGPPVLQTILSELPTDFPVPILIVQHIAAGFTRGFVDWLANSSSLTVQLASSGQLAVPGHVYVAPDGVHLAVGADGRLQLHSDELENGLRPSVSYLFRSVAKAYGPSAVGVLLTGMGRDGAAELRLMKDHGAITIAQDQETSVVHGMPGEAIKMGGATYILPSEKISLALTSLATQAVADNKRASSKKPRNAWETGEYALWQDPSGD
ncbi:MAG: chemotaxis-specific protein-glutamate methyltransferase CheB [Candidatus Sulfotelmatobacter sp.]